MQHVLDAKIQHKIFDHLIIGTTKSFLDSEHTNNYVYRAFGMAESA